MSRSTVLLATLAVLLLAAPAGASFSGSNGKVAWLALDGSLMVDDPWDDAPAAAYATAASGESGGLPNVAAPRSSPSWSPDGTTLLYTEARPDGSFPDHAAVYRIAADGTGRMQVSSPYPGKLESCETCDDAEVTWDYSPVYSAEGDIAFVRFVAPGDNAPHVSERGTSVWVNGVNAAHFDPDADGVVQGIVWPAGWIEPLALLVKGSFELVGVSTRTVYASGQGIVDVDSSPDGSRIAYTTISESGYGVVVIQNTGVELERFSLPVTSQPWARFTNDGNAVLVVGCAEDRDEQQHCGFITHRLTDPTGDVRVTDPVEVPYLDTNPGKIGNPSQPGMRSNFDIQGQDLPVVYAPGFLGSEIQCNGATIWMPSAPPIDFSLIRLAADGQSNATCPTAGATGDVVGKFLGSDIYAHAEEWLKKIDPPGGYATFGWDWRKAPQESLDRLDQTIDELLQKPLAVAQGARRVSLVGHSYGGLLIRTYIDDPDRAKKVARVLTVGSPFNGSPKSLFAASFGVELPDFSVLDGMILNDDLHEFARNLAGLYHLFPSDSYGPWLSLNGTLLDQGGVKAWVFESGGVPALLDTALQHHRDNIDGFLDYRGRIDVRAVAGLGEMTPGSIDLARPGTEGGVDVSVHYLNGDQTVPGRSAVQGPIGTADPLGDDIHIQYQCRVAHMDMTKDAVLQTAYADFLRAGTTPRKMGSSSCTASGKELKIYRGLVIPPPQPVPAGRAARLDSAAVPVSDAELAGQATVMKLPDATRIITSDGTDVPLAFHVDGATIDLTPLDGEQTGQTLRYGPVTGDVVVGAGHAPVVTVDGQPVAGIPLGTTPGDGTGPSPTPTPSPAPTPTAPPTATPTPVPVTPRVKVSPKTARLGRVLKVSGSRWTGCRAPVKLALRLKKRTVAFGSAKVTAGGTFAKRVKLSSRRLRPGNWKLVATQRCATTVRATAPVRLRR